MDNTSINISTGRNRISFGSIICWIPCLISSKLTVKITTAITKLTTYSTRPCPNGCSLSAGLLAIRYPNTVTKHVITSDRLLKPSDMIETEPVIKPIVNFTMNNNRFAIIPMILVSFPYAKRTVSF